MKRDARRLAPARSAAWLGGTALFGILACQPPGTGPGSSPDGDSIAVRPDPIARMDTGRSKDTLITRANPSAGMERSFTIPVTEGAPCSETLGDATHCDGTGQMWFCWNGSWMKGKSMAFYCVPGQTRPVYNTSFGFNGIDKSGRKPLRASRQARAVA